MSTRRRVILLDPYPRRIAQIFSPADCKRLEALGEVIWQDEGRASDDHVDRYLPDAFALVGQTNLPAERLQRATNLRAICNVEGNFQQNIDYDHCQKHGIAVLSCAPAFAPAVAEMALALTLALARGIIPHDAAFRRGEETYSGASNAGCHLLRGRRFGLLGCGNVGRALLPLLFPFSRDIRVHDPWLHPSTVANLGARFVSMPELFGESDVLFLLSAATRDNAQAIGEAELASLPNGALVLLLSRSDIVNFDALLDAADRGRVRAAIDVFPEEPLPAQHRARATRNVILSGHRAGGLAETYLAVGRMVVDDLEMIANGLPPQQMQRAQIETVSQYRSKPVSVTRK